MEEMPEEKFLETNREIAVNMSAYYCGKVQRYFWENSKDYISSFKYIDLAFENQSGVEGLYLEVEFLFLSSMIYLDAMQRGHVISLSETNQTKIKCRIDLTFERLEFLTSQCPFNNLHKLLIMKAEVAKIEKRNMDAASLYIEAIQSAKENSFLQYEALATELLARLWHSISFEIYAKLHIRESLHLYGDWGSKAKIRQICEDFPEYVESLNLEFVHQFSDLLEEDVSTVNQGLDLRSISKAMETVSNESNLEQAVRKMMNLIIENSGAQRGIFLLGDNSEELLVVAEGNVDNMLVETLRVVPISSYYAYPQTLINYVVRMKEPLILNDSLSDPAFNDPYFETNQVKSALCLPIVKNKVLKSIIYLENNLMNNAFNETRTKAVELIATQMTLTLENAKFSQLLESEKRYRLLVSELEFAKKRLEEFIDTLCHELRNPLNGVCGNQDILAGLIKSLKAVEMVSGSKDSNKIFQYIEEMEDLLN